MIKVFLSLFLISSCHQRSPEIKDFEPHSGQEGKDVVWVPTPQTLVDRMLDIAEITPNDFLIDLGSGDGRVVISAAKRGIRGQGIEYNPQMVDLSKRNAEIEGVSEKVSFVRGDLFQFNLSKATIITMFLLPELNLKLRPALLNLKPGTRILSNTFTMEEWIPEDSTKADEETRWKNAYLWIVPAKVTGTWNLQQGELILDQEFQMVTGELRSDGNITPIQNGKLRGNELTFLIGDSRYTGQVNGNYMEGVITRRGKTPDWWKATRKKN